MKAILVPYCVDQNAPSKPVPMLYDIPEDTDVRDKELKGLFSEYVCEMDNPDEDLMVEPNTDPYGYSDLTVRDHCADMYLFVTYIK